MYESGITVIIPIYNSEKYLDKMMASIYSQTFKDFNLVLVNDGSSDMSEKIVLRYMERYPDNIIYIKQKNKGVSEARNVGMTKIDKKYTLFLDSDDYIDKTMFEKIYEKAEKEQADITMCGYEVIYDYYERHENIKLNMDEGKVHTNSEILEKMLKNEIEGQLWNKMFLSRNLVGNSIEFPKGRIIEDLFPVVKMVSVSKKIAYIDEPLYKYRKRLTSLLHVNKELDIMKDQVLAYREISELVKNKNLINDKIYYYFIAFVEAMNIKKCMEMNLKCNREIYERYIVDNLSIKEILTSSALFKVKIKLLLYKMNILHYFYYLSARHKDNILRAEG